MARTSEALCFIADYHALTTVPPPDTIRDGVLDLAATLIAFGLDPERTILYRQSDVPEICELAWILGCVCPKGLMNRAHAYKAAVQENVAAGRDRDQGVGMGLFDYPILMAADILIHRADRCRLAAISVSMSRSPGTSRRPSTAVWPRADSARARQTRQS